MMWVRCVMLYEAYMDNVNLMCMQQCGTDMVGVT